MADRNVSTGAVYAGTLGTGNRNVSAGAVYVTISPSADRNVSAGAVYVAIARPSGPRKVGGNVTVLINGVNITVYIDNSRLEGILKTFQSTVFSSTAQEYIPTTGKWAFPLGGKWSIASDGVLFPIVSQGTEVPFVVRFDTVNYTWTTALLVDYRIEAPSPRDAIQWMAAVAAQGAPVRT